MRIIKLNSMVNDDETLQEQTQQDVQAPASYDVLKVDVFYMNGPKHFCMIYNKKIWFKWYKKNICSYVLPVDAISRPYMLREHMVSDETKF